MNELKEIRLDKTPARDMTAGKILSRPCLVLSHFWLVLTAFYSLMCVELCYAAVLPPDAVVAGKTIPEWRVEMLKAQYLTPLEEHPELDPDGAWAGHGQPQGPVFRLSWHFLANSGTWRITIPEDKYVFIPLASIPPDNGGVDPPSTIPELYDFARGYLSLLTEQHATIDGVRVANPNGFRVTVPPFSVDLTNGDNWVSWLAGFPVMIWDDPIVEDGYGLMLEPLSPGEHVINFGVTFGPPSSFSANFTDIVTVATVPLTQWAADLGYWVEASGLQLPQKQDLLKRLNRAEVAFGKADLRAGTKEIRELERHVNHELAHNNPAFAEQFIAFAENVIRAAARDLAGGNAVAEAAPNATPNSPQENAARLAGVALPPERPDRAPGVSSGISDLPREDFWVPDGEVHAILQTNGIVYIGGKFDFITPVPQTLEAFDSISGAALPGFPRFNGPIKVVVADGVGGWFVGGLFTAAGGVAITNLAHIFGDNTVDKDWQPKPDGAVLALACSGERLYCGGTFERIGSQPRANLAAIDARTGAVLSWVADVSSPVYPSGVHALVLSGQTLFIGGVFSYVNGVEREKLASVNADTGLVSDWHPNYFADDDVPYRVDAMAMFENLLYVGGTFTHIGAIASFDQSHVNNNAVRFYIAAFDTTRNGTNSLTDWNPGASNAVSSLAVSCDTVYAGGSFTNISGKPRNYIAALDRTTGMARDWNPDADGPVSVLALADNRLYVGGSFTTIGEAARDSLAALDLATGKATLWHPQADHLIGGLVVGGDKVVAGGTAGFGGLRRQNLAAFDARTGKPLSWDPSATGSTMISGYPFEGVHALAFESGTLFIGGPFTSMGGLPRNHLAAVDANTGAVKTNWNPNPNGIVRALVASDGLIFAGGAFTAIGGQERARLAAVKSKSGQAASWKVDLDDEVFSLAVSGKTLYLGGRFLRVGDELRRRAAAIDIKSGSVRAWNPGVDSQVSALASEQNEVLLGGLFARVGSEVRQRLAAVDDETGLLDPWNPHPERVNRFAAINTLHVLDHGVYAGGVFDSIGGASRLNLARLSPAGTGSATQWDPSPSGAVNALSSGGGMIFAGGRFAQVGGQNRPFFAAFPPVGSPRIVLQPQSLLVTNGQSARFRSAATGLPPLSFQWQHDGTNVPGANGPILIIPAVRPADAGEYTVIVTNVLGLINSQPAHLTVLEAIRITMQPASQTVAPGAAVDLSVDVSAEPPPVYQWRLNGVNIPGAIFPSLIITNAQPANGGSYSVLVANIGGLLESAIAAVVVTSQPVALADNLAARVTINAASGQGSGSNVGASKEAGEPDHAGKPARASVWLGWKASQSGIASFNTRGSGFDTLLAVYTGTDVAHLTIVTSDDDRGGFATSQASFNAMAGQEYLIAIDGFAGASGNIVLSWNLDTSTVPFPRIINQPMSETIFSGSVAIFAVDVASPTPVSYQWFFGCRAIPGATNSSLIVTNAREADVGNYRVYVMNASAKVAQSVDAFLEIGKDPKGLSRDKWEDLLFGSLEGARSFVSAKDLSAATGGSGFIPVFAGTITSQLFNNTGATTQQGEPNHCGVIGGSSRWFGLQPQDHGTMMVDTIGSTFDTVLAVYTGTNSILTLHAVACDNNSAPDGIRSRLVFPTQQNANYSVAVDGVNGAQGTINLTWRLQIGPPTPLYPTTNLLVSAGSSLMLSSSVNALPPLSYQWFFNGHLMAGQTASTLHLASVQPNQAGAYSVIASNFAGMVTNTVAVIKVGNPIQLNYGWVHTNNQTLFRLTGPSSQRFLLQASSDLISWNTLYAYTNSPVGTVIDYRDPQTPSNPKRFYRVLPWP